MPPVLSKLKNKKVHSQTREVISNVLEFMSEEARSGTFIIPVDKCQVRTARATGASLSTVQRVKKESTNLDAGEGTSFVTPDKNRNKKKHITELDDFDKVTVRRTVHNFFLNEKKSPTINDIRLKLSKGDDECVEGGINFKGSNSSLRKILKELGFKWQKTKSNRSILIEKHDIINQRISYLRQMKRFRENKRSIVYLDESYILSSHVQDKSWSDDKNHGILKQVSKGDHLIIVHAGGEMGFIPNALLMWKSSVKTGDYHHQMNQTNYEKWMTEMLIPNLPKNSVVVFDNAPYHSVLLEKVPNSGSCKKDMQNWLQQQNIPYGDDMLRPTLYELIKRYKPAVKKYKVDEILKTHNHTPLRLPPYHPDLNPIETAWSLVKRWVASRNTTYKLDDVKKLFLEKFEAMTKQDWEPLCRHVVHTEDEYRRKDGIIDNEVEQMIITLGGPDSDDSDISDPDNNSNDDEDMTGIEEF